MSKDKIVFVNQSRIYLIGDKEEYKGSNMSNVEMCPTCGENNMWNNKECCDDCEEYEKCHTSCCDVEKHNWAECDICPCCKDHSSSMWADRNISKPDLALGLDKEGGEG